MHCRCCCFLFFVVAVVGFYIGCLFVLGFFLFAVVVLVLMLYFSDTVEGISFIKEINRENLSIVKTRT